jgi:hypothetical protein
MKLWRRNKSSKLGRMYCCVPQFIQWLTAGWKLEFRIYNKNWKGVVVMLLVSWRRRSSCVISGGRNRYFSPPEYPNRLWDPQAPIQRVYSHLPGVNRPWPEAGLFSSYKAEFQNAWSCNSAPSVYLHVVHKEFTLEKQEFLNSPEVSPTKCAVEIPCPRKSNWRLRMFSASISYRLKSTWIYTTCLNHWVSYIFTCSSTLFVLLYQTSYDITLPPTYLSWPLLHNWVYVNCIMLWTLH